jgi:hypothetical protein
MIHDIPTSQVYELLSLQNEEVFSFTEDEYISSMYSLMEKMEIRNFPTIINDIVQKYYFRNISFVMYTKEIIQAIMDFMGDETYIDCGCGLGLLKKLIGKNIIAIDKYELPNNGYFNPLAKYWVDDIIFGDAIDIVRDNGYKNIILSFPPMSDFASNILEQCSPDNVIYIGEPEEGCTGDDYMFDIFKKRYILKMVMPIYNIFSVKPNVYFFKRNNL